MPTLYTRNSSRPPFDTFSKVSTFHTYRAAVEAGQQLAGYGNFYIDTGASVPSREDQLLLEPRRSRRATLLDDAALED